MSQTFLRELMRTFTVSAALVLLASTAEAQGAKPLKKCPPDAVVAGTVCMDKYEASVWHVPDPTGANKGLVQKIRQGKVKLADLQGGGATQRGLSGPDYDPECYADGFNCLGGGLYAVSLPGVKPASFITWFEASMLCAASQKRLPTNGEWQVAATMYGGNANASCNNGPLGTKAATGAFGACISEAGTYDMTGNVDEWVADWVPRSTACPGWDFSPFTDDGMCLAGASTADGPGALLRGGNYHDGGALAGPLAVSSFYRPSAPLAWIGFRCAR